MKRTAFAIIIISVLLFSSTKLVKMANTNPSFTWTTIDPIPSTIPPSISIYEPQNNTVYPSNNITVSFSVRTAELEGWFSHIINVECFLDNGRHNQLVPSGGESAGESFDTEFNMSSLPWGKHNLTVTAGVVVVGGFFERFFLDTNSTVFFTLDAEPPVISGLSVENKTYNEFDLPLNFTVDESCSSFSYVLDNQINVTINGNTTLSGLPVGIHNVTVYAEDAAGNMGASETIYFTIAEPFPTSLVITSVVPATVVLVGLGLLVYKIKRK